MSKTEEILQSVTQLRNDFKTFNDIILPAIEKAIQDQVKPIMDKQIEFERRLSLLERKVDKHLSQSE